MTKAPQRRPYDWPIQRDWSKMPQPERLDLAERLLAQAHAQATRPRTRAIELATRLVELAKT